MKKANKTQKKATKQAHADGQIAELTALAAELDASVAELRATVRAGLDALSTVNLLHLSIEGRQAWEAHASRMMWTLLATEPAFRSLAQEYAYRNREQPFMPPALLVKEVERILMLRGNVDLNEPTACSVQ